MKPRERDITGVILVGGASRRMGRDKAFLEFAGQPLFERVLEVFRNSFEHIVLVGNREERFTGYGIPVMPDIVPGSALGGIYTGLCRATTKYVFVSSCDLPFPSVEVLQYICSLRDGNDVVVPTTANGYEPLFALYSKSCCRPIKTLLDNGEYRICAHYPQVRVRHVPREELAHRDRDERAFFNVNTEEDFTRALVLVTGDLDSGGHGFCVGHAA